LVLQDLGELQQARALFERAYQLLRKTWGENHPTTKLVAANLARLN
jgi:hypothetical protein